MATTPKALALYLPGMSPRFHAKTKHMKKILMAVSLCAAVAGLSACTTIASSTNILSDERIKSETAGVLGYSPGDLTITSRRTEGVNTYVNLQTKDHKEFTCIVNAGNLLSMGLTNPPMCNKKGEPIQANPFQK